MIKTYMVPSDFHEKPLMDFLKNQGYSASMLKKMVQKGGVSVNGEFHRNIDPVYEKDLIAIDFPDAEGVLTPNGNLSIKIVYENEDFLIFDKPDDILVHPATKGYSDALGNYFAYLHPKLPFRALGRLDRHTTGLCFIAKNRLTAVTLNHQIQKEYLALAEGEIFDKSGIINAPLIRVEGPTIKQKVSPAGKTAITHYETLKKHENYTFIKLVLKTGRTHQIRAHLAHIGHPLVGDSLYGGHLKIIKRQALHCSTMRFSLNNQEYIITSELPTDFKNALDNTKIT